jgi:hypothetical protein
MVGGNATVPAPLHVQQLKFGNRCKQARCRWSASMAVDVHLEATLADNCTAGLARHLSAVDERNRKGRQKC